MLIFIVDNVRCDEQIKVPCSCHLLQARECSLHTWGYHGGEKPRSLHAHTSWIRGRRRARRLQTYLFDVARVTPTERHDSER